MADGKTVLVYGDSNAWGWIPVPEVFPTRRLAKRDRWCEIMGQGLGPGAEVINSSLSGRRSATEEVHEVLAPDAGNGLKQIGGVVATHMPLDLVIVALGTNDFKEHFHLGVLDIAINVLRVAAEVGRHTGVATVYQPPNVLILCPPPLGAVPDDPEVRAVFSEASIENRTVLPGRWVQWPERQALPFSMLVR